MMPKKIAMHTLIVQLISECTNWNCLVSDIRIRVTFIAKWVFIEGICLGIFV